MSAAVTNNWKSLASAANVDDFKRVISALPGDEIGGLRLVRKDVLNGHFGWWLDDNHGFISLANLVMYATSEREAREVKDRDAREDKN